MHGFAPLQGSYETTHRLFLHFIFARDKLLMRAPCRIPFFNDLLGVISALFARCVPARFPPVPRAHRSPSDSHTQLVHIRDFRECRLPPGLRTSSVLNGAMRCLQGIFWFHMTPRSERWATPWQRCKTIFWAFIILVRAPPLQWTLTLDSFPPLSPDGCLYHGRGVVFQHQQHC